MLTPKKRLIITGDRVLIEPDEGREKTSVGLYLPQTVTEKETVQSGRIVATGPGMPLPSQEELDDEPWKQSISSPTRFIPMQAQVGDAAIFLKKYAVEIRYNDNTYLVLPQAAILVLLRDE